MKNKLITVKTLHSAKYVTNFICNMMYSNSNLTKQGKQLQYDQHYFVLSDVISAEFQIPIVIPIDICYAFLLTLLLTTLVPIVVPIVVPILVSILELQLTACLEQISLESLVTIQKVLSAVILISTSLNLLTQPILITVTLKPLVSSIWLIMILRQIMNHLQPAVEKHAISEYPVFSVSDSCLHHYFEHNLLSPPKSYAPSGLTWVIGFDFKCHYLAYLIPFSARA